MAGWTAMSGPGPSNASAPLNTPAAPGAPAGDFGEADDELLIDGQEEVFSRSEVESGRIEHHVEAGGGAASRDDRERTP